MSTGLDCEFFVYEAHWYYALERYEEREAYDCYGPFLTYKEAAKNLQDTHANPGGWAEGSEDMVGSDYYRRLVERAIKPTRRSYGASW